MQRCKGAEVQRCKGGGGGVVGHHGLEAVEPGGALGELVPHEGELRQVQPELPPLVTPGHRGVQQAPGARCQVGQE